MINNVISELSINIPNGVVVGSNTGYSGTLVLQSSGTVFSIYTRSINNPPGTPLDVSTVIKVSADFIKP